MLAYLKIKEIKIEEFLNISPLLSSFVELCKDYALNTFYYFDIDFCEYENYHFFRLGELALNNSSRRTIYYCREYGDIYHLKQIALFLFNIRFNKIKKKVGCDLLEKRIIINGARNICKGFYFKNIEEYEINSTKNIELIYNLYKKNVMKHLEEDNIDFKYLDKYVSLNLSLLDATVDKDTFINF